MKLKIKKSILLRNKAVPYRDNMENVMPYGIQREHEQQKLGSQKI